MLPEITTYAGLIAAFAGGAAVAVLATSLGDRLPVPAPALLLVGAAALSDLFPGLFGHVPIRGVERVAVIALVVILLNGGLGLGVTRLRGSLGAVLSLGLLGTLATAGVLVLVGHVVLGFSWALAGVVAAAIAPTDPAVVFSVLGRREVGGRTGTILEGEAGVNDPVGIALLLLAADLALHPGASPWHAVGEFVLELGVGTALGVAGGLLLERALHLLDAGAAGLRPVLVLAGAFTLYGLTTLAHGSGFLAVFAAGIVLGDAAVPYRGDIERVLGGLASFAELVVFIALGLTVSLGGIAGRDWIAGLVLAATLAAVVRPPVVVATLARSSLRRGELGFLAFSGLKGAVPILLAAFALLAGVPGAHRVYDIVFVVVLLSVVVQGSLVPAAARRLGVSLTERPALPWELSVQVARRPDEHLALLVEARSWADGRTVSELPLGEHGWPTLVVRDHEVIPARPQTELLAGDVLNVLRADDPDRLARCLRRDPAASTDAPPASSARTP